MILNILIYSWTLRFKKRLRQVHYLCRLGLLLWRQLHPCRPNGFKAFTIDWWFIALWIGACGEQETENFPLVGSD
jgi:hypothetical protein